jgi:hypothetical protein
MSRLVRFVAIAALITAVVPRQGHGAAAPPAPATTSPAPTSAVGPGAARLAREGPVPLPRAEELDAAHAASGRCGVCHPRERADFARGLHAREGVRCVSCHRGSDTQAEQAAAHAGMTARPSRAAVAALCGSCHSDPRKMGPYGLPVDEEALYRTSEHGRRASQDDAHAATCIDCHGAHESLPASDPRSLTHRANRDQVCARCHGAPAAGGTGADVMAQWRASVHGARSAGGKSPGCTGCHGVHGSAPTAAGDVGKVCGQCHGAERRYLETGGHAATDARPDAPQCAGCHGSHAIHAQTPDSLVTSCVRCHRSGSREDSLGRAMRDEYRAAAEAIDVAAALVAKADAIPVPTEDYHARLDDARRSLASARPAAHSVALAPVHDAAHQAHAIGDEVRDSVGQKMGLVSERWLMLIVYWLFAGLLLVVLDRWRRRSSAG